MNGLADLLEARGYVQQHSADTLAAITDAQKRTVYLGIDPSADSLHVGQLQMLLILRYLHEAGHRVIVLVGGGTGMIGDPSGKSEERNLLDEAELQRNAEAIRTQISVVLGSGDFEMMNNADWLGKLELLSFLRDIGKHFTVNDMLRKDSVRLRIQETGQSISFTEFSYQILQAYDFLYLYTQHGCDVQVGASDQWGNIAAGIDLIRRKTGDAVHGFTAPLLLNRATGKKFGKSEGGAIWLSAEKTSPFAFYQFWMGSEDDAVEEYLKKMTILPLDEIARVMEEHRAEPTVRHAQHTLAAAATALVHSSAAAEQAARVSRVVFGADDAGKLSEEERELLVREAPSCEVRIAMPLTDVLIATELATSKREARQFITDGAVTLNGARVSDTNRTLMQEDFQNAPVAILRRGKRQVCALVLE